jgi:hypothetical protein
MELEVIETENIIDYEIFEHYLSLIISVNGV